MEKWKIIVIVLLMGSLAGYGFFQANPGSLPTIIPTPVVPTPTPDPKDLALIGKPAPEWNIPAQYWTNTDGPIKAQDLKGKVTLLEFWRSGCPHCEAAAPFMIQLYKDFKPRGLQVIAIQSPGNIKDSANPENKWESVKETVAVWGLNYPVAFDKDGVLFKTKYNGHNWPTMILIDRQGKILHLQSGHDQEKENQILQAITKALGDKAAR
jgi:thiol-disulfide isomerase/thioredoxin